MQHSNFTANGIHISHVGANDELSLAIPLTIFSNYGSLIGITLLITMIIHSCRELFKTNKSICGKCNSSPSQHKIIILELISLSFCLISCVSFAFLYNDYFTHIGPNSYTKALCGIGYLGFILGYNYGKLFLLLLFIYRIYLSFENTSFSLNKLCLTFMLIFYIFIAIITGLFFLCRVIILTDGFIVYETSKFSLCTTKFYDRDAIWKTFSRNVQITFATTELIVSIYTLYSFVIRVRKLSSQISQLNMPNINAKNIEQKRKKIQQLKSITTKQMILALISILSTQCLLTSSAITSFSIILAPWDIVINSLSIHLMQPFTFHCNKLKDIICNITEINCSIFKQEHVSSKETVTSSASTLATSSSAPTLTTTSNPSVPHLNTITKLETTSGSLPHHTIEMQIRT